MRIERVVVCAALLLTACTRLAAGSGPWKGGEARARNCLLGSAASCPAVSCREIFDQQPKAADGNYWIAPDAGAPFEARCLMSVDGGGWTLVARFPTPKDGRGLPGWNDPAGFGETFVEPAVGFKLADPTINALKTLAFRLHGTATRCLDGPCTLNATYYFRPSCTYASDQLNGAECGKGYLDVAFQQRIDEREDETTACSWHHGLVSAECGTGRASVVSNHDGEQTAIGGTSGPGNHAYSGRYPEDPSMEIWVK